MIKRGFDIAAAVVGLALLSPVMLVVSALVRRDSEGPAIFRQLRVGRDGEQFTLLKFRSMAVATAQDDPAVTARGDPRVTHIGARLRSTKLDELPQLINVLRGEMSIVGPRPEVPKYVELWTEEDRKIVLSVRPGITDPATLGLRREEELLGAQTDPEKYYRDVLLPEKLRVYRDYVQTRSLAMDLDLVFRTVASVFAR